MGFEVIPGIDVSEGKLCFLGIGGPTKLRAFGADPVAAAEAFIEAGARRLHVVDVDLAFTGIAANVAVVRRLSSLGVPVQASGGMVTADELRRIMDAGADRAVLSSAAFGDRGAVSGIVAEMRERVVIGIETEGGRIRPRGRRADLDLDLGDTLIWLGGLGAPRFLYTNTQRVGELRGPALEELRRVVTAVGARVIASGGVTTLEQLHGLARLGIEGAVVGRALYEGDLNPAAAFGLADGRG